MAASVHVHHHHHSGGNRDSKEFEDYFSEISDIEQAKDSDSPSEDDDGSKTPDEGEQELAWLKDAGYGNLVSKFEEGKEIHEEILSKETSSLTRAQAATVKKRVETLNETIRKKQKVSQKPDVRDVFSQQGDTDSVHSGGSDSQSSGGVVMRNKRGNNKPREVSLIKSRGGYDMTGGGSVAEDQSTAGVETLSIQSKPKAGATIISIGTPPVSDTDVSLNFALDQGHMPVPEPQSPQADGSGLPNFVLIRDALGITRVNDLGKNDLAKLRSLALIELTALYDNNNISYTRRKAKKRLKEHGVFGVPLQTLLEHDQKRCRSIKVPRILQELVAFLEKTGIQEEGILRVPGSATRIKALRQEIEEKFSSGHFKWDDIRPNDAAGLLKLLLRELPVPLLTFEYLEAFAQVEGIPDRSQQLQALTLLVLLLPDVHRDSLKLLLRFLKDVVDHEENKMTLNNVAMIMAPNLFLVQSGRRQKIKDIEIRMAAGTSNIVKMLLKYQDILWTVPSFMVAQIRHQYETEQLKKPRDKSIMKFLGRKDKTEVYKKPVITSESDFQEGVIRVQAPHLTKFHTAVQLESSTTAGDIVNKFRRGHLGTAAAADAKNSRKDAKDPSKRKSKEFGVFAKENTYLYEIGGNIGERRLDHNANMLALLRVNPNAEWIIQNKPD